MGGIEINKPKAMADKENQISKIREKAEAKLANITPSQDMAGRKLDELIHELQVHQIELEMQNEELKISQIAELGIKDRFIDLYDFAPVGYFTFSRDGLIKEVNLRGAELLWISRTKLINRRFGHFVVPSDFDIWNKHLLLSLSKNGEKHSCELNLKCEDGSTIFVKLDSVRMEDMDGTFQIRTAVSDITQRRQMEIELEESENRYRRLFEAAQDGILILDADTGKIYDVNPFLINILGYSHEEFVGKELWELRFFKDIAASKAAFLELQTKGYIRYEDLPLKTKDGRSIDVEFVSNSYQVNNKKVIQCNIRDITQRKLAEEELKKHREHLEEMVKDRTQQLSLSREKEHAAALYARNLIETSLDPLITINKDGTILDVNKATELVTGFLRDQLIGTDFSCYFTEPEKAKEGYNLVFIHGFVRDYPLAIRHTSGKITYVLYNASVYRNETGEIEGVFAAARDVTERKRAEKSMRFAKEEAEHANMAKTNFLQTMSHELRTPLNAVLGFSEMLKLRTSGELNKKQEHYIDNIIKSGNNLHNIINQILDIVKMYEGKSELRIEKIPVPETLDEIISVIKENATKKNVLIEKNLDMELEYIDTDKQKFKQVFINLLDNAVKFSKDEGGTVTINAKKEGNMAKFSVSDRGIGIKEEDIEEIFQKFTQLDSGTSRKYGGMGIGLAITKQFVELLGGKIYMESKYGEGSTFTFLIPLKIKNGEI